MTDVQSILLVVLEVAFGFAVGSFLCVIIERMPVILEESDRFGDMYGMRPWKEVIGGSSRCSTCGEPIRARDKIPLVSWLVLRGQCRGCGDRIPAFHPVVELAVPAVGAAVVISMGWGWQVIPVLWLVPVGIAVSAIDFRTYMVPTRLVWPAFFVSLALSVVSALVAHEPRWLLGGVVGLLAVAGPLFVIWFILPRGMGFGDVRLATLLGWTVGFGSIDGSWVTAFFIGVLTLAGAAVVGIVLSIVGLTARGRHAKVPFAPSLVIASLVCACFAGYILNGFGIN